MDIKMNVARRIRVARAELDLNQSELAALMRVNQKLVSRIESGRVNIGIETLGRVAEALQKPITYFFEPVEELRIRTAHESRERYDPGPSKKKK